MFVKIGTIRRKWLFVKRERTTERKDRLIRGVIIERDNYEKQASSPENKE